MTSPTPRIGISWGDPGGIGPEVIIKAFQALQTKVKASYLVYASRPMIEAALSALNMPQAPVFSAWKEESRPGFFFTESQIEDKYLVGKPAKSNGLISFHSFSRALEDVRLKKTDALVTAPISKHSWHLAGIQWAGHTDYLHHLYSDAMMTFWSENLKVALFTHHLPLKDAVRAVNRQAVYDFILLLNENLDRMDFGRRRILMAGLNPHAGEEGLLGTEEKTAIGPAVNQARREGIPVEGPFPPDIVFRMARGVPEAFVIGLYHDQGLIPFKWDSFDEGVNATLGMPFLRTSPDHGTAFDIAGSDRASPASMIRSLELALRFARHHTTKPYGKRS